MSDVRNPDHLGSLAYRIVSVGSGVSEPCCCQSDPLVGSVVDRVESLQTGLTEDEVHSRSTLGANVLNNQINLILSTTNFRVQGTRPDLSVRGQFEFNLMEKKKGKILLYIASYRPMIEHIRN